MHGHFDVKRSKGWVVNIFTVVMRKSVGFLLATKLSCVYGPYIHVVIIPQFNYWIVKPGSQYDAWMMQHKDVTLKRWNRLDFYSSVAS